MNYEQAMEREVCYNIPPRGLSRACKTKEHSGSVLACQTKALGRLDLLAYAAALTGNSRDIKAAASVWLIGPQRPEYT